MDECIKNGKKTQQLKLKIHESVFSFFNEIVQYNTCPMVCLDKEKQGSWNTWKPFDSE